MKSSFSDPTLSIKLVDYFSGSPHEEMKRNEKYQNTQKVKITFYST
jgi:hypothetical protein